MKKTVSILFVAMLIVGVNLYGTITKEVRQNFFNHLKQNKFEHIESIFKEINEDDKNELIHNVCVGHEPMLCYLASQKNLEAIKFLIKHGAKVNNKSNIKIRPLYNAAYSGSLDIVKYLVENNAEINYNTKFVPLNIAAAMGFIDIVEFLIQQNADVNKTEAFRTTPLHKAAQNGHVEVVKLLLDNKAKIDAKSVYQEPTDGSHYACTPLYLAVDKGYQGECSCHPKEEFHAPNNINVVRLLLDRNANINEKCILGLDQTPLHHAAVHGCDDIIELLIERGADRNAKNKEGNTPYDSFMNRGIKMFHLKDYDADNIEKIKQMLKPDESSIEDKPITLKN